MAYYYVSSGVISTGPTLTDDYMYIYNGGVANSTTLNWFGGTLIKAV